MEKKSKRSQKHLIKGLSQLKAHWALAGSLGSRQLLPAKRNTATHFFLMVAPMERPAPLLSPATIMTRLLVFDRGSYHSPPLKQLFC